MEFDRIRQSFAAHCATSLGKRLALSVTPTTKPSLVIDWLGQLRELMVIQKEVGYPPLAGIYDIRESVRASAFPTPLEADELAKVAETLSATANICNWVERIGERAPKLSKLASRVQDLSSIGKIINEAIDSRGEVRDFASPKLASIRRSIDSSRAKIKEAFDRILRQGGLSKFLQYAGSTFHGDRMVLPLRAEQRGRIPGIVHRTSDSGATLFVEPSASVELNNVIVRLRDEESKEITIILRKLTQHVQVNAPAIQATLRSLGVLDFVSAKCKYAKKHDAVCAEIDLAGVIDLHEARHPLLIELFEEASQADGSARTVVPIDVRLGDDFDVLMITGPNTGGKTVAIKTIGLLALMTQCGLPIPAEPGSRMPVFDSISVDVGDEQSLQQSLSTFSAHLSTMLAILKSAGPKSLVLVDELGSGTDPDEGAAIGRSIIAELLSLGAKAIITTHLSALKAVAYTTDRVDNASVEFDAVSLSPTYRLRMGEPGNSNALIIAKRLGMPARIVQRAKSYLNDNMQALNKAIAGTLKSRREAELARKKARESALKSQREQQAYEQHRQELSRSQAAFDVWTKWINELDSGDRVFVRTLRKEANVVRMKLHKQQAVVSAGSMDLEVPIRDLTPPPQSD